MGQRKVIKKFLQTNQVKVYVFDISNYEILYQYYAEREKYPEQLSNIIKIANSAERRVGIK